MAEMSNRWVTPSGMTRVQPWMCLRCLACYPFEVPTCPACGPGPLSSRREA